MHTQIKRGHRLAAWLMCMGVSFSKLGDMVRYRRSGRWANLTQSLRSREKVDPDAIELCSPLDLSHGLSQARCPYSKLAELLAEGLRPSMRLNCSDGRICLGRFDRHLGSSTGAVCVDSAGAVWVGWSARFRPAPWGRSRDLKRHC
jgi:hypothetical protein